VALPGVSDLGHIQNSFPAVWFSVQLQHTGFAGCAEFQYPADVERFGRGCRGHFPNVPFCDFAYRPCPAKTAEKRKSHI
ncbi:hypothetical protein, partial [Evtepia gabavorous]|uniref:hypothetical protein n=1 Tax=Evtepia gabavorous TaxID=2211183 RepID=UPI003A8E0664